MTAVRGRRAQEMCVNDEQAEENTMCCLMLMGLTSTESQIRIRGRQVFYRRLNLSTRVVTAPIESPAGIYIEG
jgi:Tfp pilus assembly PilM family ATPase